MAILVGICSIILLLISIAAYLEQKPITKDYLSLLISKNNSSVSLKADHILLSRDNFDTLLNLPMKDLSKAGFDSVYINNTKVVKDDQAARFYYQLSNGLLEIKTRYLLKPSENTIRFVFRKATIEYRFKLEYSILFDRVSNINNDYWFQGKKQWVRPTNEGLLLLNNGSVSSHYSFGFRRRFENNVELELGFIPKGNPVNMSIYFGEGCTVYMGIHDDRSIQLVLAKKDTEQDEIYETSSYRFLPGKLYRIKATKNKDRYTLVLLEGNQSKTLIGYTDTSPEDNKEHTFKNIGIGLWEGSKGILIKELKINSSETL